MRIRIVDTLWNDYCDYRHAQLEAGHTPSQYNTWLKHELKRQQEEQDQCV